jgi:hypothetical protein
MSNRIRTTFWRTAMRRALVTGSGERVVVIAGLLAGEGVDVTVADPSEVDGLDPGRIDHYVQLPVTVRPVGDSLVGRVRSFLAEGLLGRFALVERLLPALAEHATVVLVAGNVADSVLPDDESSRFGMLAVLAHATRAELAPRGGRVTVADGSQTDSQLVQIALRDGEGRSGGLSEAPPGTATDKQYEDWRTEVMGAHSAYA